SRVDGVVALPDGKLLAAGTVSSAPFDQGEADSLLLRYTPSGSLDPSFGNGGQIITDLGGRDLVNALALQKDGKLLLAGEGFLLARFNADGQLDPSFGRDGRVKPPADPWSGAQA